MEGRTQLISRHLRSIANSIQSRQTGRQGGEEASVSFFQPDSGWFLSGRDQGHLRKDGRLLWGGPDRSLPGKPGEAEKGGGYTAALPPPPQRPTLGSFCWGLGANGRRPHCNRCVNFKAASVHWILPRWVGICARTPTATGLGSRVGRHDWMAWVLGAAHHLGRFHAGAPLCGPHSRTKGDYCLRGLEQHLWDPGPVTRNLFWFASAASRALAGETGGGEGGRRA